MDLSNYSLEELRGLQSELGREIQIRENKERASAIQKIKDLAAAAGLDLSDLTGGAGPGRGNRSKRPKRIKYQHTDNPDLTWSGYGRRPKWIEEARDAGIDIEQYNILGDED